MSRTGKRRKKRTPQQTRPGPANSVSPPAAEQPRRSLRFPAILAVGLLLVAAAIAVRTWVASNPLLRVPVVESQEVHPTVAKLLNEMYTDVVESPESADAWGEYGIVLLAHSFRDEAAASFEEAGKLNPKDYRWPYYHGITTAIWDRDVALKDFELAARLAPRRLSVRLRLAEWYYEMQSLEKAHEQYVLAEQELKRAMARREDVGAAKARTELGMARVLQDRGEKKEALTWAQRAVKSPGGHRRDAWQLVAQLYQQLGDSDAAIAASEQAEKAPQAAVWSEPEMEHAARYLNDASLLYVEAEQAWSLNETDKAIRLLLLIGQSEPNDIKWKVRLGEIYRDSKRLDEGVVFLDDMVLRHPASAELRVLRAQLRVAQGKLSEARADCEAAITVKPNYDRAYFVLGQTQVLEGTLEAAVNSFRDATRLNPQLAGAFVALGDVLNQVGKAGEAAEQWRRAVKLAPKDSATRVKLAELLIAEGQPQEAVVYLREAIETSEDPARAKQLLLQATAGDDSGN